MVWVEGPQGGEMVRKGVARGKALGKGRHSTEHVRLHPVGRACICMCMIGMGTGLRVKAQETNGRVELKSKLVTPMLVARTDMRVLPVICE